ncbi:NUDIX domain-containing protein [Streptomyces sp. NBC_00659]|uniref:NUDIX hydrolase n=1 Tax=Streptomyces sp. NBC_00659 TaxID=2903669 RepID=UPI002E347E29|nr:NUDIX domain-containing protein [Streptomyces sp. NBC_00659]
MVIDTFGRVLPGRSTGAWGAAAGRIETGEAAPAAAVRELAEETGLTAARGGRIRHQCAPRPPRLGDDPGVSADLYGRFAGTG